MRVVSLLPSATEHLFFVGGGGALVGRSHECDFPPGIEAVPALTAARTNPADTPDRIDQMVREQLEGGGSLYTLNADLLARLQPDLILTQDLCEVCSIDVRTVRRVVSGMSPQPRILSLNPGTFEEVLDDALRIGEAVGRPREAAQAVVGLRERFFRAAEFVNPYQDGPSVAFLEWTDPLFVGGHWTPQLIERAGGRHPLNPTVAAEGAGAAAGPAGDRRAGKSIRVSFETLVASRPERVVICPCGVGLERGRAMARDLAAQDWWAELPAVRAGQVALVDGNHMFSRPGPRLVDAFEWLVGWLNGRPELIPAGFPWEPIVG
jgi:ABC-type Fe3+-hydroxamate transport system substrate-binding protein